MIKKLIIGVVLIFALSILAETAQAFWVWTPKTGKWVNPKYAAKDTPEEQLEWAMSFFKQKKYDNAIQEYTKLIKSYPHSNSASEAQYYMGLSYENLGKYYEAFLAFQKVINTYPNTERINEIIEREYKIGDLFMNGQKRQIAGISILPAKDKAIEIFKKVVENARYGQYADSSQYKMGLCYKEMNNFQEAISAFEKISEEYPDSSLTDEAEYQLAVCSATISRAPDYDQMLTDTALEKFEQFIEKHPDSEVAKEAEEKANQLREKKAEEAYQIGRFYERRKALKGAEIYYNEVVEKYQNTSWAPKALNRLQIIMNMEMKEGQKK